MRLLGPAPWLSLTNASDIKSELDSRIGQPGSEGSPVRFGVRETAMKMRKNALSNE